MIHGHCGVQANYSAPSAVTEDFLQGSLEGSITEQGATGLYGVATGTVPYLFTLCCNLRTPHSNQIDTVERPAEKKTTAFCNHRIAYNSTTYCRSPPLFSK